MKNHEIILSPDIRAYHLHDGQLQILKTGIVKLTLRQPEVEKLREYFKDVDKGFGDCYDPK